MSDVEPRAESDPDGRTRLIDLCKTHSGRKLVRLALDEVEKDRTAEEAFGKVPPRCLPCDGEGNSMSRKDLRVANRTTRDRTLDGYSGGSAMIAAFGLSGFAAAAVAQARPEPDTWELPVAMGGGGVFLAGVTGVVALGWRASMWSVLNAAVSAQVESGEAELALTQLFLKKANSDTPYSHLSPSMGLEQLRADVRANPGLALDLAPPGIDSGMRI